MSKELKALNEEMLRWEDVLNKCETHSEEMYIKSRIKNIKLRIQIERLSQVINQFTISQPMKPIIMECTDEVIKQSLTKLEDLKQKQEKKDKLLELKNREIKLLKARLTYNDNDELQDVLFFENSNALEDVREQIKDLEEEMK